MSNKSIKFTSLLALLLTFGLATSHAFAQSYSLTLASITALKLPKPSYRTIYFVIQKVGGLQIHTKHWTLKRGESVTKEPLWKGKISSTKTQILEVKLFEKDTVDLKKEDKLITTFKITLKNEGKTITSHWKRSNTCSPGIKISGVHQEYEVETCQDISRYKINFRLSHK